MKGHTQNGKMFRKALIGEKKACTSPKKGKDERKESKERKKRRQRRRKRGNFFRDDQDSDGPKQRRADRNNETSKTQRFQFAELVSSSHQTSKEQAAVSPADCVDDTRSSCQSQRRPLLAIL